MREEIFFMYQKMYTTLFNSVTKALDSLVDGDVKTVEWLLKEAQRETESMFMEWNWENSEEKGESPS